MGLYLCVMDADENEIDGVEVGTYEDWGQFRDRARGLGAESFSVLLNHSDCDGEWPPEQCEELALEIEAIGRAFRELPPIAFAPKSWQAETAKTFGIRPASLYDCYFDVDGEPLIERIAKLAWLAKEKGLPILLQ